ncbi:neutrophil gelatinase-associated lipocalin isoform X2 [Pteropus medius]|uniref:neutrophil gelatinase-associated lipocalin isoform X2 n=1 Tax=Pteropus vampyrus TaxID=132908 RepID=UPI00196A40DB|nr:neutrophil gelatinase-associated lipocalin isoform X2 [Pteropus giganteus]
MGVGLWPGGRGLRCRPALFCPASVREVVTAFHLRAALAAPEPVTSDPDGDAGMPVEAGARGENDGFREADGVKLPLRRSGLSRVTSFPRGQYAKEKEEESCRETPDHTPQPGDQAPTTLPPGLGTLLSTQGTKENQPFRRARPVLTQATSRGPARGLGSKDPGMAEVEMPSAGVLGATAQAGEGCRAGRSRPMTAQPAGHLEPTANPAQSTGLQPPCGHRGPSHLHGCSPYTPQPGLGLSRGLLEVRDDSSTRSEPLTTNRANQSRRNGYRECQGTLCPCQRCGSPGSAAAQCPHPEIMTLGLLWLGLTLLGALQTQAQASTPNLIPAPPLLKVPLQQDFQDDQFQGKWYVVGLAGNAVSKEEQGKFKMYSTTYQLKEDHSYNVTSILFRDQNCDYFIRTFVPSFQPGQFSLGNIKAYPEVQSYTVRVVATNYHQFAMVFFKKVSKNKEYFKITLYGRTKELTPELKEDFVHFTKSLGLTDDHILFPVPIDKCIDE